jgi:hypothetical protein
VLRGFPICEKRLNTGVEMKIDPHFDRRKPTIGRRQFLKIEFTRSNCRRPSYASPRQGLEILRKACAVKSARV